MSLDHEAIRKAYPLIKTIDDSFVEYGLDIDGNKITIDQSKVNEARTSLNTEALAVKYKTDRAAEFPDWQTQLDYIFHHGVAKWKTDIVQPVKEKFPKPS